MSLSRILGIIGGVGALCSAIATAVGEINPKWGGLLTAIGAATTMFTERVQGGASKIECDDTPRLPKRLP
jgi:hypothetical protein